MRYVTFPSDTVCKTGRRKGFTFVHDFLSEGGRAKSSVLPGLSKMLSALIGVSHEKSKKRVRIRNPLAMPLFVALFIVLAI